jgi:hypothetical protein
MEKQDKIHKTSRNIFDYLLLAISLTAIFSAGIYYIYALNWISISVIILLVIISFILLYRPLFNAHTPNESDLNIKKSGHYNNYLNYWPYLAYLLFFLLSFYFLNISQSDKALISPWQVVKSNFFIFYTLSSLSLVFILLKSKLSPLGKLLSLSAHYFLSFSVAAIVYKIGYGFDPFIHQATMELIDKKGLVTPKPFYYLGEYGLVVIFHKLSGVSIYLLNKFLLPVLAAIFLPLSTYRLAKQHNVSASRWLLPLFILGLTFSPFIATTPQNLSYLFLILTIIFGLTKENLIWPLTLATATLAIHPLTGIPALCWWLVLALRKNSHKLKEKTYQFLKFILFCFSALILPLALFISGGSDFKKITLNFYFIIDPIKNLFVSLNTAGQENWLLNIVYFFSYNYNLWLIIIMAISLIIFYRQKAKQIFKTLIFINLALAVAYIISSQIIFTDLIDYEQTNFAARLLILITIFFLPFIISELQKLITLILTQPKIIKITWLVFGLGLVTISLYVSYPRYDSYFNSRGYSTGINDITAVKLIAQEAKSPYIVLANQQVSVAALKESGFDHYYNTNKGQIFFYPIPTGGELYKYYLDMVYKNPSRETMTEACALTGVKESYLIVNKYWYQSDRIISAAKLSANSWQTVNNEVYIFKYLP